MESAKRTIALLSGGLDSSVSMALCQHRGNEVVLALSFDYGQRSLNAEISAAKRVAEYYGIPHQIIALPWFEKFSQSGALLSKDASIPHPQVSDLSDIEFSQTSANQVWVPNRNGVFIEIAAGLAEDKQANQVIVGFNREEAATFPDNSVDYMEAISKALSFSTANQVSVGSPTATLNKTEIVAHAIEIDFPFSLLWSCYENASKMCGRCESCMRLKRALNNNEVKFHGWFKDSTL